MQSSLVLSEMGRGDGGPIAPPRGALRRRRDITTLTPAELNSYRDAWRLIQNNGQFRDIASYHGCSLFFCHRPGERIIFLPWHREYVLRLENALGEAVHYWDWTSAASASSGIPPAFTAATYVSADGNTYPNPLRSFRFSCPAGAPGQTTSRFPQSPLFLQQYASQVQTAYGSGSYAAINALLENPPHDNVHGWVGGTMGAVTFAAYDPIFWAHHTNVDRQWASWQQGGGADPIASVLSRSLTGFTGRTVNDVKSIAALNYEYDRYDTMPAGPFVVTGVAGADGATKAAGVGKTFNIEVPLGIAADRAVDQPLDLLVSGVAEHPTESYFVYVFVNKPDATPAEATPANPNFAGTFAIFGGAHGEAAQAAEHDQTTTKKVLQLFEGQDKRFGQPIRQVTLVVTDPTGAIVSREDIPFDGVTLRSAGETGVVMEGVAAQTGHADATAASQIFTGVSNTESYDEAYRDAVNKAQTALNTGGADRLIKVRVLSVDGERGGIAGLQRLRVTITARIE
jgi:hypothetical protein